MGRYSVAELFKAYAAEKAGEEWHGEWAIVLFYRPIAIFAAPAFLRLSIPASMVTSVSLVISLCLPAIAMNTGAANYLVAGFLGMLVIIFDCVDGTIARATATVSRFGHYLDFSTDVVFRITFYMSIGLMADLAHAFPLRLDGRFAWTALLAALFAITARLCRVYAEHLTGAGAYQRAPGQAGLSEKRSPLNIFSAVSGLDSLLPFFVIVAGAWNALGWVVSWLLAYSVLDFLYTQFSVLRRL